MTARKPNESLLQHALRRSNWQPQRQVITLAALGFVLALIMGGLYLSQVVSEATTNRRLEDLLDERDDLERENESLRAEIASFTSVPNLQSRAESLGFTLAQPSQIEYLPVDGYRPIIADTVAPIEAETPTVSDVYDETFGEWLGDQWNALMDTFGG